MADTKKVAGSLNGKMIAQAICQHCRQEFEAEAEERTAFCPFCGRETSVGVQRVSYPQKVENLVTRCPSCKSEVSTQAVSCPKCGHQFRYAGGINLKDPVHVAGLIICAIIIIGVILYIIEVCS